MFYLFRTKIRFWGLLFYLLFFDEKGLLSKFWPSENLDVEMIDGFKWPQSYEMFHKLRPRFDLSLSNLIFTSSKLVPRTDVRYLYADKTFFNRTTLNIKSIADDFCRYVYRFVCDLQSLLGYTPEELHAMVDLQPLVKKEEDHWSDIVNNI